MPKVERKDQNDNENKKVLVELKVELSTTKERDSVYGSVYDRKEKDIMCEEKR